MFKIKKNSLLFFNLWRLLDVVPWKTSNMFVQSPQTQCTKLFEIIKPMIIFVTFAKFMYKLVLNISSSYNRLCKQCVGTVVFDSRPPVSLTMALSPARYAPGLLHPVPPPPIMNREPTPKQDSNSDNDGKLWQIYISGREHNRIWKVKLNTNKLGFVLKLFDALHNH